MPLDSGDTGRDRAPVRWGEFEYDPSRRELRRRALKVKLQPMVLQVLGLLLERPGEVVTREDLHKKIWNGYAYSDFDHNLNIAINKLRAALNDPAKTPQFIETIPQTGYRFIHAVGRREETPAAVPAAAVVSSPWRLRLALGTVFVALLALAGMLAFGRRMPWNAKSPGVTETPPVAVSLGVPGGMSGPFRLDGSGASFLHVPNNPLLEPATITVNAWVRASEVPEPYSYVVAKGAYECWQSSYAIYTGLSRGLVFYVSDWKAKAGVFASADGGRQIWDSQWHQVTGTFDGSVVRLFVDGKEVSDAIPVRPGSRIRYGLPQSNDLFVGIYGVGGKCQAAPFKGEIDGVSVFNRALTPREIAEEFRLQQARRSTPAAPASP